MRYFPVFLDLQGKTCVVVGGGRVGERKVRGLLKAGARVKVISPELTAPLLLLRDKGKIAHVSRTYRRGDLQAAFLAVAATGDRITNEEVFREALGERVLVNVVDDPGHSSFIVPSIVDKKDLLVAVSTSGRSPALARVVRRKLEKEIGPEYGLLLDLFGKIRKKLLSAGLGQRENANLFRQLAKQDLFPLVKERRAGELNRRLKESLGPGFSLRELGLKW